jgi:tetratricopeptide (TPR) repeat protein
MTSKASSTSFIAQMFHGRWLPDITDVDIERYLHDTEAYSTSASERLRQLAIYMSEHGKTGDPADDWAPLRKIYERAHELDPNDPSVLSSWGISATNYAKDADNENDRNSILADAEAAHKKAAALDPRNADIAYALGTTLYADKGRDVSEALQWFQRALELQSDHYMAQMYVGHCLQDMGKWKEALEAYLHVDQDMLAREWPAWRSAKLKAQIALCHLRVGARHAASEAFVKLLNDLEKIIERGDDPWDYFIDFNEIVDAATGELRSELFDRAAKLVPDLAAASRANA